MVEVSIVADRKEMVGMTDRSTKSGVSEVVPAVRTAFAFSLSGSSCVLLLGCQGYWQAVVVYLIGRLRFQAGVGPYGVIELQIAADRSSGLADRGAGTQVDRFVLDGLPDALDEDIVAPAVLAVHADPDSFFFEPPGEGFAGEPAALVGVEDFRFVIPG